MAGNNRGVDPRENASEYLTSINLSFAALLPPEITKVTVPAKFVPETALEASTLVPTTPPYVATYAASAIKEDTTGFTNDGEVSVLLVNVSVPASVASVPVVGRVTFVAEVAVNVLENAPLVAKVLPFAKVRVAEIAGGVIITLFTEVAKATPNVGVVNVGLTKGA